jgi:hypothetical protein
MKSLIADSYAILWGRSTASINERGVVRIEEAFTEILATTAVKPTDSKSLQILSGYRF